MSSIVIAQEKRSSHHHLNHQKYKVTVYPVPAHDAVFIEMDSIDFCKIKLYNSFGKQVITAIPDSSLNRLEIQTNHLDNGRYQLQIIRPSLETITKKIIIKH